MIEEILSAMIIAMVVSLVSVPVIAFFWGCAVMKAERKSLKHKLACRALTPEHRAFVQQQLRNLER